MRFKALAAVAALALLTGCGAAAGAAVAPKPLPLVSGLTVAAPAPCLTTGDHFCAPTDDGATEAWESFDSEVVGSAAGTSTAFKATYAGTVLQGADLPPSEYYTVPSSKPGIDHAFRIEFGAVK